MGAFKPPVKPPPRLMPPTLQQKQSFSQPPPPPSKSQQQPPPPQQQQQPYSQQPDLSSQPTTMQQQQQHFPVPKTEDVNRRNSSDANRMGSAMTPAGRDSFSAGMEVSRNQLCATIYMYIFVCMYGID